MLDQDNTGKKCCFSTIYQNITSAGFQIYITKPSCTQHKLHEINGEVGNNGPK